MLISEKFTIDWLNKMNDKSKDLKADDIQFARTTKAPALLILGIVFLVLQLTLFITNN
jgi:hypothetical protein